MPRRTLDIHCETWPLSGLFVISRGAKAEARVVVATIREGSHMGRGECVPYARYGETVESVMEEMRAHGPPESRPALQAMKPGAARNALDCALWDLEAKQSGRRAHALAGLKRLEPVPTCYTLSLASPSAMAEAARSVPHLRLLKLKLGGDGDAERMRAVRLARPDARLVVDANEAWSEAMLRPLLEEAARAGVELIEQPLPAGQDGPLATVTRVVPLCADESFHTEADLAAIKGRYDAVNIKLDKAGGLTAALALADAARRAGLRIMTGSMVSTSLSIAPAMILAQRSDWADLDSPLLLERDRDHGLRVAEGLIEPPSADLWG